MQMCRLARAFTARTKWHQIATFADSNGKLGVMRKAKALASMHICSVKSEPSSLFKNFIFWLKWRLWPFVRAATALASLHICKAYLSLRRAASNGDVCLLFTPAAKTLVSLHI